MKKSVILFLLLLLCGIGLSAQEKTSLVVELRDGTSTSFLLAEKPTITFLGELMNVVSELSSFEIKRADVKQCYFAAMSTSVEGVLDEAQLVLNGNAVFVNGLPDGANVTVYTVDGVEVLSSKAVDGSCYVSLDALPNALYIINYNKTSIKFLKK